jgi:hypothetical protein
MSSDPLHFADTAHGIRVPVYEGETADDRHAIFVDVAAIDMRFPTSLICVCIQAGREIKGTALTPAEARLLSELLLSAASEADMLQAATAPVSMVRQ